MCKPSEIAAKKATEEAKQKVPVVAAAVTAVQKRLQKPKKQKSAVRPSRCSAPAVQNVISLKLQQKLL
jgi:hypothetical protein